MKTILIVEDIHSIRTAIKDTLAIEYSVFDAKNYTEAVEILNSHKIDLLITDIKMPGKSGLDLIRHVRENYPDTLYTLITAYNINEYIKFAKDYGVWNIIPKYSFLDLRFISVMVYKLLTNDIFGVEKYFEKDLVINDKNTNGKFETPVPKGIVFKTIKSDKEREFLSNRIGKFLVEKGAPKIINQVIEELTSNAMIRAPRDEKGKSKYQLELPSRDLLISDEKIELSESDYFEIGYGIYNKTFIIVTRDKFGSLKKEEILNRLHRHINVDETTGLPQGISDSHGRGLYICREVSDSIIFNIEKGVRTEIITFLDNNDNKSYKSLSIYEK